MAPFTTKLFRFGCSFETLTVPMNPFKAGLAARSFRFSCYSFTKLALVTNFQLSLGINWSMSQGQRKLPKCQDALMILVRVT
jgi:hypothetical protein